MGDAADDARDQEDWPPEDGQEQEYPRWRGKATEWKAPTGKGPARFKIGNVVVQVWKYAYESDQVSDVYTAARDLAEDGSFVEAYGEEKPNSFFSTKAQRQIETTQRTVYGIEAAERQDGEEDPTPVAQTARKVAGDAKAKGGQGKGKPDTLSKEEWAEKDRLHDAAVSVWAAYKILIPAAEKLGLLTKDNKNIDVPALERGIRGLVALEKKLEQDRTLFPPRNLSPSTSDFATTPPPSTSEPEPSSAPAPKESSPTKRSAKPKQN